MERAFCDLPAHGPDKAQGVIVWNHGIHGTLEQWRHPVPPVFRLLQSRGWDRGGTTLSWTSSDGRILTTTLARGRDAE